MLYLLGAIWSGSVRIVRCAHCHRKQAVSRRPPPFSVVCRDCRRSFRVLKRDRQN